jgi:hypothetical protein
MEMQGLQEMQAGDGCILSSGFIHSPVVAAKSAANVQQAAQSSDNPLRESTAAATGLAHSVTFCSFANGFR